MELIKFLKDNREFLKLSAIERECGMADSTLRSVLSTGRNLTIANADKLIVFFGRFGVDLVYTWNDRRCKVKPFDTTGWTNYYGNKWEREGFDDIELDRDGFLK